MSCLSIRIRYLPWVVLAAAACSRPPAGLDTAWRAERTAADGIRTVRTLSGSVWQGHAELVEELAIGVADGAEEYMFGRIDQIAPDGHGGVYVFDGQVPVLRHYDSSGRYTRTLGRKGSGPGEYQDVVLGLAVLADGRVLLRDPRNARFTLYTPGGMSTEQWPLASGVFTSRAMYVDTAGHIYARISTAPFQPGAGMPPIGLVHLSPRGEVLDTIPSPSFPGEPTGISGMLAPAKLWDLHPHGYPVVGVSDRYAIELRKPDGTLRIEKAGERIAIRPEEKAEREALIASARAQGARIPPMSPLPTVKPYFQGLYAGSDGTIWVHLHQEGTRRNQPTGGGPNAPSWIEPTVFDVFEPDGTYLGEVRVPPRARLRTYSRGQLWATREGTGGEVLVARLRLVEPSR